MNITIVTTGGITHFFRNWPELLLAKALVRRGHSVTAFTYRNEKLEYLKASHEEIDGVQVRRVGTHGWYSHELGQALAHNSRPDVLHIFHLRNHLAAQAAWTLRRTGVPVLVSPIGPLHDPYLVTNRDRPLDTPPRWENLILSRRTLLLRVARSGRLKRHLDNYLMHWPIRHANAVLACSEHERLLWQHINIVSETVPLWVDQDFIRAQEPALDAGGLSRPVVLFVAQLKYRKGFDVLAQAMPRVIARFPKATFLFVSHSPIHRKELESIAEANGSLPNLKIVERASEAEKVAMYRSADVLAFPSRYEGFGLPLLEAMAAGCPVVSTRIPVIEEIVCDGENGLLVPRDDAEALAVAIMRVIEDSGLRERLVSQGFETLKRFDEARLVRHIEEIYRRLSSTRAK